MFGKNKADSKKDAKPNATSSASKAASTGNKADDAKSKAPTNGTSSGSGTPIKKREQEVRREAYLKAQEERRQKQLEEQRIKKEKEQKHLKALKKRHTITMITFCVGLVVMVTALISIFPTTEIIIFSTLLMFTFFFLGIAYQRLVMQLLVLALTCLVITGAFYTIMLNS